MDNMEQQNEFLIFMIVVGVIFLCVMQYLQRTQRAPLKKDSGRSYIGVFAVLCALALVIRIPMAYAMPGYVTDVNCFRAWADNVYAGGMGNFYNGDFFADYPPLYIYVLYLLGFVRDVSGISTGSAEFALIVKLPALIMDIVLAAMVYIMAKKEMDERTGIFLSVLILFNPAVMVDSAVWGQVDVFWAVMIVIVIYLLYREKYIWSAVAFILAFLLKPQAIIIAPLLLFVFVRNIVVAGKKLKPLLTLLISLGVMVGLFFLVPLPFGINKEPLWLIDRYLETMGQYPQATLNAFNIYAMLGMNFLDAKSFTHMGLTADVWGYIAVGCVCVYSLWLYIKKPDKRYFFALAAFLTLGVYTFVHGMHERYLFVAPVLMLFAYIFIKDKRLFTCTLLVFGIELVNICVSLYFYQVFIPAEMTVVLSVIAVAVFIYSMYVITMLALKPPAVQKIEERTPTEGDARPPEQRRLEGFKQLELNKDRKLNRKDALVMLIITVAYAVVAFLNLGVHEIPSTSAQLSEPTGDVIIEFESPAGLAKFKYYADYGQGDFEVYTSEDGQNYELVNIPNNDGEMVDSRTHELGNLYRWWQYDIGRDAKYMKLHPVPTYDNSGNPLQPQPTLPILEIAVYDNNGNLLEPVSVTDAGGNEVTQLFDEQNLVPGDLTYMTDFYFDELYHVRTAYENIHGIYPYELTHPPLGKVIIASGIEMFGMNPFGWRFMGTLTGVLMLPVIYAFAKRMFKKTGFAAMAATLFAVDFMHFTQTRIGTVDSYSIIWIMLMYLFMYKYTQTNFNLQPIGKTLTPLFLCGLFFGLGAATKWLCIYAGAGLLVIFLIMMYRRYKEYVFAKDKEEYADIRANYKKNLAITLASCVGFFILIPAVIYIVSYAPYFFVADGKGYTGISDIIGNQKYMLGYHAYLNPEHPHPFASKWYTWPLDIRPVLFFNNQNPVNHTIATLSTMGNPLIWWSGIVAAIFLILDAIRKPKRRTFTLLFLGIAALSQFMPWWFISRELFIYHYFATVPFLILVIVYWLKHVSEDYKYGPQFAFVFVAACVTLFAVFYPVITGVPADSDYINGIRWLQSWPFY